MKGIVTNRETAQSQVESPPRVNMHFVERTEKLTDEELISSWKGHVSAVYIAGVYSRKDFEYIRLIELELEERPYIDMKELDIWYKKAQIHVCKVDFCSRRRRFSGTHVERPLKKRLWQI